MQGAEGTTVRIVIAVDDSRHSERATRFVAGLRWPAGSRVIVANVTGAADAKPLEAGRRANSGPSDSAREQERIVRRAQDELRAAGLSAESRPLRGDVRDELVKLVEAERVDLVVLGSHGRTGLSKLLMGSVASHVVTHAPCSVLVVKEEVP